MKVAHLTVVSPGQCGGLYETTRELVVGLRARGVDSRLVDPIGKYHPGGTDDRGATFADTKWAMNADVLVSHSGLGKELENSGKPVILCAHGRPLSSWLTEMSGSTKIYTHYRDRNKQDKCKAVVTFWPEHKPYLEVMFPDTPVKVVDASVDLNLWSPEGPKVEFDKRFTNVVIADVWRNDVDPFVVLNAFALWAREHKNAKLHLYALQDKKGPAALIKRIQDDGNMGSIKGLTKKLAPVYRGADLMITPHTIGTRTVREAMACGCPVVQ